MSREHMLTLTRKDFQMEFFRAGGKGGQNQNKVSSAVRIRHIESGAVGECREERDQHKNRKIAFKRLTQHQKFKIWLNKRMYEIDHNETTEQYVERMMAPQNMRVEVLNDEQKWVHEESDGETNHDNHHHQIQHRRQSHEQRIHIRRIK